LANEHVTRKLAAILAADVVSYSRLMGVDEIGTLRAWKGHRGALIDPVIAAHGGRIVKTTGDGLLVDFASVVDAVAAAVAIQQGMPARTADTPPDKRIVLRVGINVGDIIIDDNDIFGDGVNIAARLESICRPGGLCISDVAQAQVRDKLPLDFDDLGEQTVKNIARPVRCYGLTAEAIAGVPDLGVGRTATAGTASAPGRRRGVKLAAAAAVVLVIAAAGGVWAWLHSAAPSLPAHESSVAKAGDAPDAPPATIAVLPLASLAADGKDDYFATGLTDDIITALGRFSSIAIRSPDSVAPYKGKKMSPEAVGHDLGVRYVVDGSVQHSPSRVRVTVRLTDAMRGALLWSEQYDAELKDIFAVQDDITRRVAGHLAVRVSSLELERAATKPPANLEAYDLVLRSRDLLSRVDRSANSEARGDLQRAVELDPTYAPAFVALGTADLMSVNEGWTADPSAALQRAEGMGQKAVIMDERSAGAHALLGRVYLQRGEYDRALDQTKRAVELNPSDADAYAGLGGALVWTGDLPGAIKALETAAQLAPTLSAIDSFHLSIAYLLTGRTNDAIGTLERSLIRNKGNQFTNVLLAAAYAQAGRPDDAKRQAATVHQLYPFFDSADFGTLFRDPKDRDMVVAALQKAGL
jgi:TolB-like protein/class 3 adenylate cyclase/Flp pilus assembly protein TadD